MNIQETNPIKIESVGMKLPLLAESGNIPNHPDLPVILYPSGLDPEDTALADSFQSLYRQNGWQGVWRWGVYDFHHYHSNAHEVLGVSSGEAELCIGGQGGKTIRVQPGDVIILPAGTGHKCESSSPDFQVVGAYPAGQEDKDLIRDDEPLNNDTRERVRRVHLPESDPIFGQNGPLCAEWKNGD